jgi:type III restriction enzyme
VLTLDPAATTVSAELAPALGGAADMSQITTIDLEKIPEAFRLQRLTFQATRKLFAGMEHGFSGTNEYLAMQLVRLVEQFLASPKLSIPSRYHNEPLRRRILIALNIDRIVEHLSRHLREVNTEKLEPIFDQDNPIGSTARMRTWYTTKPNQLTTKSPY